MKISSTLFYHFPPTEHRERREKRKKNLIVGCYIYLLAFVTDFAATIGSGGGSVMNFGRSQS
jgi:hypothetical protein